MDHLTHDQLTRWRSRSLSPQETLAVSDHVAQCESCRAQLRGARTLEQYAAALDRQLAVDERADTHLRSAELVALAGNSASPHLHAAAAEHLKNCALCRGELEDLRRFAAEDHAMREPMWRFAAAAGVALFALGITIWLANRVGDGDAALVERSAPGAMALVTLRDAHGEIVLLADGSLRGAPKSFAAAATRLLRAPTSLALPAALVAVTRHPEQQRTTQPTADTEIAIIAPSSSIELEDHPLFHWTSLPDGVEVSVSIFDSSFDRVATSGPLRADHWRADHALPRGVLLTWAVEATIDGHTRSFPAPPQAPAVFQIASDREVARIAAARATGSHLLLGLALWDAGCIEQAVAEFSQLRELNPDSRFASDLASQSERALAALREPAPES